MQQRFQWTPSNQFASRPVPPSALPRAPESKGVVYTKRWVVELLLDLCGYCSEANLVDAVAVEPAAGCGAFLGPMIERLIESCRRVGRPLSDCHNSLVAFELDAASANSARELAVNVLVKCGVDHLQAVSLASSWIRTGDYLLEAMGISADFVVSNPPYVRLEDIPEGTAAVYRETYYTMRGRADLYIAFFEAALCQLRDNGVCAFICADRWMRNQYGAELRKLVSSSYAVEVVIEMHNADAFHDEVDAYPAIVVIRRKPQSSVVVASASADVEDIDTRTLSRMLLGASKGESPTLPIGLKTALIDTWFEGDAPWPCRSPEQLALLRKLERKFPALESSAKVGIGVATGNDGVFITRDSNLVEQSRLLKLALAGDIGSGSFVWSGHYLVDPWESDGLVELSKYPRLEKYFTENMSALKNRHTAKNNARGWYKTIDRVTHSLVSKPKLYVADIKDILNPVLDNGDTYPHHNLYFIESANWDLEVLGGLLMSEIGHLFVASYGVQMRGGYWRFQAQYLRRIRVPSPELISETDKNHLIAAFRERNRDLATTAALRVYGVTREELEEAIGSR